MMQLKPCDQRAPTLAQGSGEQLHSDTVTVTKHSEERTGCAALENFPNRSMMLTVACPGHVKQDCGTESY